MPKKIPLPASPRHILLNDEDWTYLESRFGPRGIQPVGVSVIIRAIIHQKVLALRAAEAESRDAAFRSGLKPDRVSGGISSTPTESHLDVPAISVPTAPADI